MSLTSRAYRVKFGGLGRPDSGPHPEVIECRDPDLLWDFFWSHVRMARASGRDLPSKPRRKLRPEELAEVRRSWSIWRITRGLLSRIWRGWDEEVSRALVFGFWGEF